MTTLITSSASLLGKYLLKTAPCKVIGTYHWSCPVPSIHMDITNPDSIKEVFETVKPQTVIHCAAIGDVDKAETDYDLVKKVNVEGTKNVVSECRNNGTKLVFISTNAVFDGQNPPYKEDSERRTVNKYGELKIQAENEVMRCPEWIIIRPILLYGYPWRTGRGNLVTRVLESLREGKEITVVDDIISQPTYAGDLASKIWGRLGRTQIMDWNIHFKSKGISLEDYLKWDNERLSDLWNKIYHIANPETTTLYDFAVKVAEVFDLDKNLIKKGKSIEFGCAFVERPKNTTYDTGSLIRCSGIEEGLRSMKNEQ